MSTQAMAVKFPVLDAIEKAKGQLGGRLPEGMTQERFVYGLMTSVQKNPALLDCNPSSVLLAAYEAAECGCDLSPSKALGWLIPYGKVAQFQPSYRHFIQLAYQSGAVKAFNAEVVYSKDKFKILFAPVRNVIHEPNLGERGEPVGVYALIQFIDDHIDFEYLSAAQIAVHKNASKKPDSLMWTKFWEEAWRKTAIRVLSKRLPQSNPAMERLAEIVQKDADADLDVPPNGEVELEKDSPLLAKTPASTFTQVETTVNDIARPSVNFYVGRMLTFITGQTRPIEKDLKTLHARRDEEKHAWTIPASATEQFLKLCEDLKVDAIEVDESGDIRQIGTGTMADLFNEQRG